MEGQHALGEEVLLRQTGSELAGDLLHLLEDDFMGPQLQQAETGPDGLSLTLLVSAVWWRGLWGWRMS